jgi:ubiquinone biosynthesis protein COQ4
MAAMRWARRACWPSPTNRTTTGILFIAYAGARQIGKVSRTKAPLFAAIKEGRKLGKAAGKIAHQDIAALMREDIGAARARLNIGSPEFTASAFAILESEGVAREQLTLGGAGAQAA